MFVINSDRGGAQYDVVSLAVCVCPPSLRLSSVDLCFQMAAAERKGGGYKVHVIKEGYSYTADNGRKTLKNFQY